MLPALIINVGPVFSPGIAKRPGDIGAVDWYPDQPPPEILTISGNGSSHFAQLAIGWKRDGHILPQLLAQYGRSASDYSSISLSGFSAGHGLVDPLLLLDGDSINAAVMFDACFTLRGGNGKSGYASFGERAARGERLLVLTSSHGQNGKDLPPSDTGSECALASFDRSVMTVGASTSSFEVPAPIPTFNPKGNFYGPGTLETHRAGLFFVLDYGPLFFHGDHINLLSRDVLSAFLAPYIATGQVPGFAVDPGAVGSAENADNSVPVLAAAGALTLLLVYLATRDR